MVPDHEPGRRALRALRADQAQATADAAAQAGRLAQAVSGYDRVLELDPERRTARVNRGMARVALGDVAGGVPDLEAAVRAGNQDPAVANALAFGWVAMRRSAEAIALLTKTQTAHPNDIGLANNLARLLLTAEPASLRDPGNALTIAAQLTKMHRRPRPAPARHAGAGLRRRGPARGRASGARARRGPGAGGRRRGACRRTRASPRRPAALTRPPFAPAASSASPASPHTVHGSPSRDAAHGHGLWRRTRQGAAPKSRPLHRSSQAPF